jgi:threonine dehydrogenase-like Zn-dependent dehydrogenase
VTATPTDAVVRVVLGCVCGSDLWYYRGESPHDLGPIGHEFIGVVTDVGSAVTNLADGDFVVAPFTYNDGPCPHCLVGWTSNCANGGSGTTASTAGRARLLASDSRTRPSSRSRAPLMTTRRCARSSRSRT